MLAQLLRDTGDLPGARAMLEAALDEAPHFLPLYQELADVMLQSEPASQVAEQLDLRLGDRAHGVSASLLLATSFYERAELDYAEQYYQTRAQYNAQPRGRAHRYGRVAPGTGSLCRGA